MTSLIQSRHRPFGPLADQFGDLLRRYPRLDRDAVDEMIAIYPRLTILEIGLLSADDVLGERLQTFTRDHPDRLKHSWRHHVVFMLGMLGSFALLALLIWGATA